MRHPKTEKRNQLAAELIEKLNQGIHPLSFLIGKGYGRPKDKLAEIARAIKAQSGAIRQDSLLILTYDTMVIMQVIHISERFKDDCARMKRRSMSNVAIARACGVDSRYVSDVIGKVGNRRVRVGDGSKTIPSGAPEGAQAFKDGTYYKIGRHGYLYRYGVEWTRSNRRPSQVGL